MGRDSDVLGLDWADREGQETRGGRTEWSGWVIGFEHSLKVGRASSSCCTVGKRHGLVVDASFD